MLAAYGAMHDVRARPHGDLSRCSNRNGTVDHGHGRFVCLNVTRCFSNEISDFERKTNVQHVDFADGLRRRLNVDSDDLIVFGQ